MIDERIEAVFAELQKSNFEDILVVGIGNSLKADDGIGSDVCSLLKKEIPDHIIDTGTVPENYIQVIIKKSPRIIFLIDAIDFNESPGTIKIFTPDELLTGAMSTHGLPLRHLSRLITQSIPAVIYVIGIQPKSMTIGHPMSPEVQSAKSQLVERFLRFFPLKD